jgi:hypothetical protein
MTEAGTMRIATFFTHEIDNALDLLGKNSIPVARLREIREGEFELVILETDFKRAKDLLQAAGVQLARSC